MFHYNMLNLTLFYYFPLHSSKIWKCDFEMCVTIHRTTYRPTRHNFFLKYSSLCCPGKLKKLKTQHRLVDIIDTSSLASYILYFLVFFIFISSLKVQIHTFCFFLWNVDERFDTDLTSIWHQFDMDLTPISYYLTQLIQI